MKKNEEVEFNKFLRNFGEKVKEARINASLTQEELSEKSQIEYKYIQRIEYGQANITLKTVYKICSALDVSAGELF